MKIQEHLRHFWKGRTEGEWTALQLLKYTTKTQEDELYGSGTGTDKNQQTQNTDFPKQTHEFMSTRHAREAMQ